MRLSASSARAVNCQMERYSSALSKIGTLTREEFLGLGALSDRLVSLSVHA